MEQAIADLPKPQQSADHQTIAAFIRINETIAATTHIGRLPSGRYGVVPGTYAGGDKERVEGEARKVPAKLGAKLAVIFAQPDQYAELLARIRTCLSSQLDIDNSPREFVYTWAATFLWYKVTADMREESEATLLVCDILGIIVEAGGES